MPALFTKDIAPNLKASLLLICSFFIFCAMAVLMRRVGGEIPVVQVLLVRQVITFILLAPLFWRMGPTLLHPKGLKLHMARGALAVGAMGCGLTSAMLLPLADATALQMSEVLMATAFAALLLGESVGWRRWTAAAIGFIGVLIMMRPFSGGFQQASLIALFGALCGAGSMIAVRLGAAHDNVRTVIFWQGLVVLACVTPFAIHYWRWPPMAESLWLVFMGVLFTIGILLFTTGMRMGEAAALAPLQYIRLLMMAALGWLLYNEEPGWHSVLGSLLIIGAASYTLMRNAFRQVKSMPPDTV